MNDNPNTKIPAYKGNEPYVFVCYSHKDSESVYSDIHALNELGINMWYDEGISGGSSWRSVIAASILGAKQFIFFISETSLKSAHCLREVDYALNHDKEIIPVYLEDCSLPPELDLVLNRVQALFKHKDATYLEHLHEALKEKRGLASLLKGSKKRSSNYRLPLIIIGLAVLSWLGWQTWEKSRVVEPSHTIASAGPSAYDQYLEGMDLLDRWDKGDNLEQAISMFREATTINPGFALAYARLASALRIRYAVTRVDSWLDEAVINANKAVNLNPNLAPVQVALGRVQTTLGNYDLAFAAIEKALAIDPNQAEAHLAIAKIYERQGRLEDAETSFEKALVLDQDSLLIRDSYANFLFRQGNAEEAARQWRAVIRVAPDHYGALVNLGSALSQLDKISESITMYEQSIEIHPTYMAYSNLGSAYARVENYPKAVAAYRKALEINDTDWLAWGNLAYVYSWMDGREVEASETFDHAIQLAEEAIKQSPRDPFIYSDLSLYFAKKSQPEQAIKRMETALVLSPDSGEIQAAAAEVYELIGQRDKAIERLQQAIELDYPRQRFQRNPEFASLLTDTRIQNTP